MDLTGADSLGVGLSGGPQWLVKAGMLFDCLVRIRPVETRDTDAVVALWREVFPEYNDPTQPQRDPAANVARKLAHGDGMFWLAEPEEPAGRESTCIGTIMAGWDGHRGWLYSLAVTPSQRGRGIARQLVVTAEDALRALGAPKINLQVMPGNTEAIEFWRSVGYSVDDYVSCGKRLG